MYVCEKRECDGRIFNILVKYQTCRTHITYLIATSQSNNTAIRVAQEEKGFRRRTHENDGRNAYARVLTHTRMYGLHTASAYTAAGPCLYGTFSGSQTAVGTINDNLSLFRCVLVHRRHG